MYLGKTLLRWLTTGALPVATARRGAVSSSSVTAVPAAPCTLPRRVVLEQRSTPAFSAIFPRRIVVDELTAASLSRRIKDFNAVQAGSPRKHAANGSSPLVPEMSLVLLRWLGAARRPGAEIASKLAGKVRRRRHRCATTAATGSNPLHPAHGQLGVNRGGLLVIKRLLPGGSADYAEKFILVCPCHPCSIAVSAASPPLPRWFTAKVSEQVRFFGVGDPFESDDGGLLPDLAPFPRRRRCAAVPPIPPWLEPPRIPGLPHWHRGNSACSCYTSRPSAICFMSLFEVECTRHGFGDGDLAQSSRLLEFESTHHGFGYLAESSSGMKNGLHVILDDTEKSFPHARAGRCPWKQLVIRRMFSSAGTRSSSPSSQQPPSPASLPAAIPSQPAAIYSASSGTNSSSDQEKRASSSTSYVDESFSQEIVDAEAYVKANPMLIKANVLGSAKEFWRLSDMAQKIIRRLARILRNQHQQKGYLLAPLLVQNLVVVSGELKLKNVKFTEDDFSFDLVKSDYQYMSSVVKELIKLSVGEIGLGNIPPDFSKYLDLLESQLKPEDEFLIVNHASLLPMSNRGDAFLMMFHHIMGYLAHKEPKKTDILSSLQTDCGSQYQDWLRTATGNTEIQQWLRRRRYGQSVKEFLRFNRNVRCHPYEHSEEKIEETLYSEWPDILVQMQEKLHKKTELQNTAMESKFGY